MSFDETEIERIDNASLILLGIQPSELANMDLQTKYDVLAIAEAQNALRNGKMPGEK